MADEEQNKSGSLFRLVVGVAATEDTRHNVTSGTILVGLHLILDGS